MAVGINLASEPAEIQRPESVPGGTEAGFVGPNTNIPTTIERAGRALLLPPSRIIPKVRYDVFYGGVVWSVNRYRGANSGLVLAEAELADPDSGSSCRLGPPWKSRMIGNTANLAWSAAQSPPLRAPPKALHRPQANHSQ